MVGWPALISAGLLSTILPLQYRAQSASFAAMLANQAAIGVPRGTRGTISTDTNTSHGKVGMITSQGQETNHPIRLRHRDGRKMNEGKEREKGNAPGVGPEVAMTIEDVMLRGTREEVTQLTGATLPTSRGPSPQSIRSSRTNCARTHAPWTVAQTRLTRHPWSHSISTRPTERTV